MPIVDMPLAQFANRASNILFGYGEAGEQEMLSRMEQLVEMERNVTLYERRRKVAEAIKRAAADVDAAIYADAD
jgi:hypothetical protein